jgi:hypothetical protein
MKTRKIYSLLIVLMLFAAGAFMYACTPDKEAENIAPLNLSKTDALAVNIDENGECGECSEWLDIIRGANNSENSIDEISGQLRVCQTSAGLIFTVIPAEGHNINNVKLSFGENDLPILNPGDPSFQVNTNPNLSGEVFVSYHNLKSYLGIIDLNDVTFLIAANIRVSKGPLSGQGWVGDEILDGRYPFDRSFEFKICGETVVQECSMSQGFWLASPVSIWTNVTIGALILDYSTLRTLFLKSKPTVQEKAYFQAAALKLSGTDLSSTSTVPQNVKDAFTYINNYFNANNPALLTSNLSKSAAQALQTNSGIIGNWIESHPCLD